MRIRLKIVKFLLILKKYVAKLHSTKSNILENITSVLILYRLLRENNLKINKIIK